VPIREYIAKPVTIQAIEWTGKNFNEIRNFCNGLAHITRLHGEDILFIETVNGTSRAQVGDHIVYGTQGEFYPISPRVMMAKYELKEE
jgi:hypothetical protein